jgi:hypothetical protein
MTPEAQMNATIEKLLEALFSVESVSSLYQESVGAVVRAEMNCKERKFAIAL